MAAAVLLSLGLPALMQQPVVSLGLLPYVMAGAGCERTLSSRPVCCYLPKQLEHSHGLRTRTGHVTSRGAVFLVAPNEDTPASSAVPEPLQSKPKSQQDRFDLHFTCNKCEARNAHSISRLAYTQGTVIVTCSGCGANHLIADNLNWIEDDFKNIEVAMEKKGVPVQRIVSNPPREAAVVQDSQQESEAASSSPSRIDGISDDQAMRIREAVRAHKRRQQQEEAEEQQQGRSLDEA